VWRREYTALSGVKEQKAGENCIMRSFKMCRLLVARYSYGDQAKGLELFQGVQHASER
jgi:hypothetical protein